MTLIAIFTSLQHYAHTEAKLSGFVYVCAWLFMIICFGLEWENPFQNGIPNQIDFTLIPWKMNGKKEWFFAFNLCLRGIGCGHVPSHRTMKIHVNNTSENVYLWFLHPSLSTFHPRHHKGRFSHAFMYNSEKAKKLSLSLLPTAYVF